MREQRPPPRRCGCPRRRCPAGAAGRSTWTPSAAPPCRRSPRPSPSMAAQAQALLHSVDTSSLPDQDLQRTVAGALRAHATTHKTQMHVHLQNSSTDGSSTYTVSMARWVAHQLHGVPYEPVLTQDLQLRRAAREGVRDPRQRHAGVVHHLVVLPKQGRQCSQNECTIGMSWLYKRHACRCTCCCMPTSSALMAT